MNLHNRSIEGAVTATGCVASDFVSTKLLTIVTVVFNSGEYIEETILSVLRNKNEYIEYLIIDGGSTDDTLEIIRKYAGDIDFILSEPDHGIYDAMNKAIGYATGCWIMFINSGDAWLLDKDDKDFWQLLNVEGHNVILCDVRVSSSEGKVLYVKSPCPPISTKSFLFKIPACHQGIVYRRSQWIPFDINFKIIADKVHLWGMFCKNYGSDFAYFKTIVAEYRLGGFSEANRERYHSEEAKFFADTLSLGRIGETVGYHYLNFKHWLLIRLRRMLWIWKQYE